MVSGIHWLSAGFVSKWNGIPSTDQLDSYYLTYGEDWVNFKQGNKTSET